MGVVALASGGIDSTLMCLMAAEEGVELFPLFVDYGQLGATKEWEACRRVHAAYDLPVPVRMDISGFGHTIPSGITDSTLRINEDAFLPGRNLLFALVGAAYAYSLRVDSVALGLLDPIDHLFPDQTVEFVEACENAIEISVGRHISVLAPLMAFSKADVLEMANARGMRGTYSCHSGDSVPCGVCVACIEIANAKKER